MDQCVRQRLGAVASDSCQYPVVRGSAQRHRLQARDFQRHYGDGGAKRSTADSTRHATQQVAAHPSAAFASGRVLIARMLFSLR